jgi:predicted GIY-YIG superfamily endonuclease
VVTRHLESAQPRADGVPTGAVLVPHRIAGCTSRRVPAKCTVCVLRSLDDRSRYYTGVTSDLSARLTARNTGKCAHTANGARLVIDVSVQFANEARPLLFERYLKSGSGCAFARRHLR